MPDVLRQRQGRCRPHQGLFQLPVHVTGIHKNLQKKLRVLRVFVFTFFPVKEKSLVPRSGTRLFALFLLRKMAARPDPYVRVLKKKYRQ